MGKRKYATPSSKRSRRSKSWVYGPLSSAASIISTAASTYDTISKIVGSNQKTKLQYAQSAHGISWSTAVKSNKLVATKKFAAAAEEQKFQRSGDVTARVTGLIGRQVTSDYAYMLSVGDLNTIMAQANVTLTGTLCVSHVERFTELHNQSNTTVKVWIYDLLCKKDGCKSPTSAWSTGLQNEGTTGTNYQYPYSFPSGAKEFRESWDIIKVTRITMDAGSAHVHNFDHYINKTITYDRTDNVTDFVAGYTTASMLVVLGSLDNDVTTKTQIAYGNSALNVYTKFKYNFMSVEDNIMQQTVSTAQPTAYTVNQNTMLEDVDNDAVFESA